MSNSGRNRFRRDRFYSPPAMRRYNQQLQEHQVAPTREQEKQEQSESSISTSSTSDVTITNLDRFMKHITPIVTAQHFSKTSMKGWRNHEDDYHPYFILGDLWESFDEWSAYGAGVPLLLNERDSVVQYYAPSLSAIQLFVDPSAPIASTKRPGEDSDNESSRATSSDSSYEAGAVVHGPRATENIDSISESLNKLGLRDVSFAGRGTDEGKTRNPPGVLVYEYYERIAPFNRSPLAKKVSDLSSEFPNLKTYRSCDLAQSSWISVAWYPIYRIPMGPSLQNVDTSFLTFHSLSTPLRSTDADRLHPHGSTAREVHEAGMPCRLSLPMFGLAVYKFKNADWTGGGTHGTEKVNSLAHSAENWLRKMGVHHPDFVFFKNHNFRR